MLDSGVSRGDFSGGVFLLPSQIPHQLVRIFLRAIPGSSTTASKIHEGNFLKSALGSG